MKKTITLTILIFVSLITEMIVLLPWWGFLVPIFFLGIVLPLENWKIASFLFGFIAGFSTWFLSTLFFKSIYEGEIMNKISNMFDFSNYIIYIVNGILYGILTGLAFYSGFLLRKGKKKLHLELPEID